MDKQSMTSAERFHELYPSARTGATGWSWIIRQYDAQSGFYGDTLGQGATEEDAWQDAFSRLPTAQAVDAGETDEQWVRSYAASRKDYFGDAHEVRVAWVGKPRMCHVMVSGSIVSPSPFSTEPEAWADAAKRLGRYPAQPSAAEPKAEAPHDPVLRDAGGACTCGWPFDAVPRRWHQVEEHIKESTCAHELKTVHPKPYIYCEKCGFRAAPQPMLPEPGADAKEVEQFFTPDTPADLVRYARQRLAEHIYVDWESAGGDPECPHGVNTAIHCRRCDEFLVAQSAAVNANFMQVVEGSQRTFCRCICHANKLAIDGAVACDECAAQGCAAHHGRWSYPSQRVVSHGLFAGDADAPKDSGLLVREVREACEAIEELKANNHLLNDHDCAVAFHFRLSAQQAELAALRSKVEAADKLAEALENIEKQGEPVRDTYELWTAWQKRVGVYSAACAALAVYRQEVR